MCNCGLDPAHKARDDGFDFYGILLTMMRILIIEDHPTTAEYLAQGLKEHYFIPDIAREGQEGLFLAMQHDYAVIILDVMLPKKNGWEVISAIRKVKQTPVLFLTARDSVDDRVRGLTLGADDYLVKPFAFSELVARIQSIIRRNQLIVDDKLQIADLEIDIKKHQAIREGQSLSLTPKEFQLLLLLAQRQGEPLTRTFIAEAVWDIHFDSDTNVIDVAIKRLREKVDKPFGKKLIHSIRGVGYVLEER